MATQGTTEFDWEGYLSQPSVRRLLQLARQSFGVSLNFVDRKGWLRGVRAGQFFVPSNGVLAQVADSEEGFKLKRDVAQSLATSVTALREPKLQLSKLGTSVISLPIARDGAYLGYVYTDDCFTSADISEQRVRLANFLTRYLPAAAAEFAKRDDVPVLNPGESTYLLDLMSALADEAQEFFDGQFDRRGVRLATNAAPVKAPSSIAPMQVPGLENRYLIGSSKAITQLLAFLARISRSDACVLITGESGTGKELVARTVHENSVRRKTDFVAVNCGAIHDSLLESELFGHVKGAFTGATENRKGYFEQADGSTLFLDEIGETSLATQVRMLRFLQEATFIPVGAAGEKKSDVRVVAATNRDLRQELKHGRFREDLFYRLKVIHVEVPALRERREDIPMLANFFLHKHAEGGKTFEIAADTMKALTDYHWPGNIRQLENEMRRLSVVADEGTEIDPSQLSDDIRKTLERRSTLCLLDSKSMQTLADRERQQIAASLAKHQGNKSRVAKDLGMSRSALARKLKTYGFAS